METAMRKMKMKMEMAKSTTEMKISMNLSE